MNDLSPQDRAKRAAALRAAEMVEDGMKLGLGTGSTAAFLVRRLGERARDEGLRVVAVATSERTAALAREVGIEVVPLAEGGWLDLTIAGAAEGDGQFRLIQGGGGALLREKIVAAASRRFVVIADEGKLVDRLGLGWAVPVEVVPFGWEATARRIERLGATPELRRKDGEPFVTDGGHLILDCRFPGGIGDPPGLERELGAIVGVVETGLFTGMAGEVLLAGSGGVRRLMPGG